MRHKMRYQVGESITLAGDLPVELAPSSSKPKSVERMGPRNIFIAVVLAVALAAGLFRFDPAECAGGTANRTRTAHLQRAAGI